jgi:hypothetical protein
MDGQDESIQLDYSIRTVGSRIFTEESWAITWDADRWRRRQ